jgi:hypothetical protein
MAVNLPVTWVSVQVVSVTWEAATTAGIDPALLVENVTYDIVARTIMAIHGVVVNPSGTVIPAVAITVLIRDPDGTLDGGYEVGIGPLPAYGRGPFTIDTSTWTLLTRQLVEVRATSRAGAD